VKTAVAVLAGLLALSACGGGGQAGTTAGIGPSGEPVAGGTGRIVVATDPRSMDPAHLGNESAYDGALGNALYGTLLVNDPTTQETTYTMAESLVTEDAGQTFTLTLRPGLVYSDGTPLTADDVAFNWEHMKDPMLGSPYAGNAREIESAVPKDDRTLEITLSSPNTSFATQIYETSLNWIAKPETLQAGMEEINARPIGAGPFTLQEWRRQDAIILTRNDRYWDAPRPYLDRLEIRPIREEEQRLNTVISDGADVSQTSAFTSVAQAEQQGLQAARVPIGGGVALVLNNERAPFNDVRARKALSLALDLELIDDSVNEGTGTIPTHLVPPESPYYRDIPLHHHDPQQAQTLLDELAAEGKPLEFALTIYSSPISQRLAQSMQTQLSTLRNITMTTRVIDAAENGPIVNARDFDIITSSIPATGLWIRLRGGAGNNYSGVDDPELNQALDESMRAADTGEIAEHYEVVQRRLSDLTPVIFYTGISLSAYANTDVGGLDLYGKGSLLPEKLWIAP
jgi:peptide/nickel transport system substrate-binding protein